MAGLLDFRDCQYCAGQIPLNEWRKQVLLHTKVLVASAALTTKVNDGISLLSKPRMQHMHCGCRQARQLSNFCRWTAQCGSDQDALESMVRRLATRLLEPCCQPRHGGLSPLINFFIGDCLKRVTTLNSLDR
ncbi:MAG: hypothetical protein U1F04_05215 [Burkholderiaceae bacterium]